MLQTCMYGQCSINTETDLDFAQIYYKPLEITIYCCLECIKHYDQEQEDIDQSPYNPSDEYNHEDKL